MKLLPLILLFLLPFNEKIFMLNPKSGFNINTIFTTLKGEPLGIPFSRVIKLSDLKYKFKKDKNLKDYHDIKLKTIHVSSANISSTWPGDLESIKIFISAPLKKEVEISNTNILDGPADDCILTINYKENLDQYLNDPAMEYRIEYVARKTYCEKKYRLDFNFTGETTDDETK